MKFFQETMTLLRKNSRVWEFLYFLYIHEHLFSLRLETSSQSFLIDNLKGVGLIELFFIHYTLEKKF